MEDGRVTSEEVLEMGDKRHRTEHSAADERRIDLLQEIATDRLGKGAAVGVLSRKGEATVLVYDRAGDEKIEVTAESKSQALDEAIRRCKVYKALLASLEEVGS